MSSSLGPVSSGNRFSTLTPDDHGGIIWTVSLIGAVYSFLMLGTRCYIKRNNIGIDDVFCVTATVLGLGQSIAIFVALSNGLGKAFSGLSVAAVDRVGKATLASVIVFLLALCFAKLSVVLLIRQLSPKKSHQVRCDVLLGTIILWGTAALLAIGIGCTPSQIIGYARNRCSNQVLRWQLIGAVDALTELAILLLSVPVVWDLQIKSGRKVRVVLIFSSRLPVAILAILYLHYITTFHDTPNVGVAITVAIVFQQCELGYSLVSSTIPTLKTFLRDFDTGMGLNLSSVMATTGYGSSNNRGGNYKLKDLSKDGTQPSQTSRTERSRRKGLQKLRPDLHEYTTSIYHSTRPESTSEDISHATAGSQEMIIHKGVEFEVRRD